MLRMMRVACEAAALLIACLLTIGFLGQFLPPHLEWLSLYLVYALYIVCALWRVGRLQRWYRYFRHG